MKIKKMKLYLSILVFAFSSSGMLSSCETSDNGETNQPSSKYGQYGTFFENVPESENVTIYQVNIRAFSEEGNLQGVLDRMDYIKSLGANVIYLMPIYPVGEERSAGDLGSPYAIKDYKAVNPEFGDLEDLRAVVDAAHQSDMAVILDFVANHTAWDNAWITEHPEYYQQDENGNIIIPPDTNWNDVAQLDYSNKDLRDAMIDAMSYWIYTANIDGFRMDAADFVPNSFWEQAVDKLEQIRGEEILMFAEGGKTAHLKSGFDYIFSFGLFDTMKEVFLNGEAATDIQKANVEAYANVYDKSKRVVKYTSNHDVNLSDGTPLELFGGKQGSLAAFVIAAYMKSVPMIYNGQEIGYDQRIEFFTHNPIDWGSADNEMLQEYKDIIAFRNSSEAIRKGELTSYSSDDIAVFKMAIEENRVLVFSNTRNHSIKYILPAEFQGTTWENGMDGGSVSLDTEITLEPYSYFILKN